MDNDEIIFHLAEDRARYFEAVTPPIIQSSNFVFDSIADLRQKVVAESENYVYSRGINPTVDILRKKIAALENAEDALVVGSGVAAISCAVMANLKTGDHVLCVDKPYSWTKKLFDQYLPKFGISVDYFVWENQESFQSQIKANTRVVFL
ncbi:MAG: PLP-dependent transferase, partial [Saprospiraceae bacterium]|nr:PLP-dependent transferase [Saprospiraceae bacterium]